MGLQRELKKTIVYRKEEYSCGHRKDILHDRSDDISHIVYCF